MRVAVLGGEARDLVNFRGHLISQLAQEGHTVYGIAPGGNADIQADLERLGATYVPLTMDRTGLNPFRDLLSCRQLWALFRRLRLDTLLAYEIKAIVFGTLAARLAGVPKRFAMITGRGSTLQGEALSVKERIVRGIVQTMYRIALRRSSGVLFQNGDDLALFSQARMLPAATPRTIVNGSGVDVGIFAPTPLPDGPVTFLFVGRLLKDKGIQEYVDACRSLSGQGASARFRILGPLDSNPKAIQAAEVAGWVREGVVEYLGEAKDVRPALAAAHVLVLPSYAEGTPRSVLEAMSMGRAIITTDAPGCRETVQHGVNGYLVPVRDSQALAAAMRALCADPDTLARFGRAGRQVVEARYDVRLVSADILRFMRSHGAPE